VVDNIFCGLYRVKKETTSHLFFECRIAWFVWNPCYAWLGLKSVDNLVYASHFLKFNLFGPLTSVNLVFGSVWIALVSEI